jgi:hypothetical protein
LPRTAPPREAFVECIHGGVDEATLAGLLAADVVLHAAVNGIFFVRLDTDGKIAEVGIFYRTLPAGVALQRNLADAIGMQPWVLRTDGE